MTPAAGGLRVVHTGDSVEIVAPLGRRRGEALALELRAMARRYGLEIRIEHAVPREGRSDETADAAADSIQ